MAKLFISQPMKGLTDEEILKVREKAIEAGSRNIHEYYGKEEPVEVLESFFQGAPADAKPLWYLGESLKVLSQADVAYFCHGWETMRGCKLENEAAIEYGIPLVVEDYSGMTAIRKNTEDELTTITKIFKEE